MYNRYEKISFEKFDEMVNDHEASLTDVKQNLKYTNYHAGGIVEASGATIFGDIKIQGKLNDVGWNGLCNRLKAPQTWMQSGNCPPDLEETIINRLKQDQIDDALLRFREAGNEQICRAVLSDQYLIYNHKSFWDDVRNSIVGTQLDTLEPTIWKPFLSDYLDVWILFEGVIADPEIDLNKKMYDGGKSGGLKPAIHIHNAEDGTRAVGIASGMFRGYCTNGVIFRYANENMMRAVHRGSNSMMKTKVQLAIAEAARMCKLGINKFLKATEMEIKTDVIDDIVKDWSKEFRLTSGTTKLWSNAVQKAQTWGDLVMATSDYAGTMTDRKLGTQFEEIAGEMLMARVPQKYLVG